MQCLEHIYHCGRRSNKQKPHNSKQRMGNNKMKILDLQQSGLHELTLNCIVNGVEYAGILSEVELK